MAAEGKIKPVKTKSAPAREPGRKYLWIAGAAAAVGVMVFLFSFVLSTGDPAAPVREVGLLLVGCAIVVVSLDRVLNNRDDRHRLRNELIRRVSELDGVLQHLSTAPAALEVISAVKHRTGQVAEVCKRAESYFSNAEQEALEKARGLADEVYKAALQSRGRRSDLDLTYSVVTNKLEAAERRGDIDYKDGAVLRGIMASSKAVLDMPMLPEWNSSHRGRLEANLETAASHLRSYKSQVAEDLYQGSAQLFQKFHAEVDEKIELLDKMASWNFYYNQLQDLINGVPPEDKNAPRPDAKPATPSKRYADYGGGPGAGPGPHGGGGREESPGGRPASSPPSAAPGGGMAASSSGGPRGSHLSVVPSSPANDRS